MPPLPSVGFTWLPAITAGSPLHSTDCPFSHTCPPWSVHDTAPRWTGSQTITNAVPTASSLPAPHGLLCSVSCQNFPTQHRHLLQLGQHDLPAKAYICKPTCQHAGSRALLAFPSPHALCNSSVTLAASVQSTETQPFPQLCLRPASGTPTHGHLCPQLSPFWELLPAQSWPL